ncbi:MAG: HD family phosphohydrolase [Desulfobacterales bacterium]|nr:MAG: HD family phosphohydrolase [Desulfobacterales bacterium]
MTLRKKAALITDYLLGARLVRFFLFGFLIAVFSLTLFPVLVETKYDYRVGDVADRDIKAPVDFFIQDRKATGLSQKEAAAAVRAVYDWDEDRGGKIVERVRSAFGLMDGIMTSGIAPVPISPVAESPEGGVRDSVSALSVISPSSAGPLAAVSPEKTDEASSPALASGPSSGASPGTGPLSRPEKPPEMVRERIREMKSNFEDRLGIQVGSGAFRVLEKEMFPSRISRLIVQVVSEIMNNGVVGNKEGLLKEGAAGIRLRNIRTQEENTVTNLKQFYGLDQAKTMVRIVAQPLVKDMNYNLVNLVVDISQRLIEPNITLNQKETRDRKHKAAKAVSPILHQIKAGEMLLREGERVSEAQLVKLTSLEKQTRKEERHARNAGLLLLVVLFTLAVYFILQYGDRRRILTDNKEVLFLVTMLGLYAFVPGIALRLAASLATGPLRIPDPAMPYGIPLASGAMTVCLFFRFRVAMAFSIILSMHAATSLDNRLDLFLYFFTASVMAAYWIRHCRERRLFIIVGLRVGLLSAFIALGAGLSSGVAGAMTLAWHAVTALISGLLSGVLSAGIVPLLESVFGYTTDITLLEQANLDRPILRRLMMEAPGTYHHSVVVGTMVEAAAAEIGANPLLAKVCGYYHDIGKLRKPLYFVENQADGKNRHDKLAPSMSSLILLSHVKEGVEIARRHKLGRHIIDAIRQHHGTSTIRFFYEKARKLKGDDAVRIENFQYPGPKPKSGENALVMLADVVEAASRTLDNPTPSRVQRLVHDLIGKISAEGQLDDCDLTLRDLNRIGASYTKILNGIHHHRIEYPEQQEKKNGNTADASVDRKPPEPPSPEPEPAGTNGPVRLVHAGNP